jgi:hypothetical protein
MIFPIFLCGRNCRQLAVKKRPLTAYPSADKANRNDHGGRDDTE